MSEHSEEAVKLFNEGYNCAQAVCGAYCEAFGVDKELGLKMASSFGGGMGRMREVCGAVSGMFMIASLKTGTIDPKDSEGKLKNYETVRKMAEEFKKTSGGSIICKELLGLEKKEESARPSERTNEYYEKRPCVKLVEDAALVIDKILLEQS